MQVSAKDMDPAALKARFGDRMAFWGGGIDAQHVLPTASPATIREHVRRNIEAWKPGGGYVFNNVHNIQAGVPPENIVALYDAAYEYGFYRSVCHESGPVLPVQARPHSVAGMAARYSSRAVGLPPGSRRITTG